MAVLIKNKHLIKITHSLIDGLSIEQDFQIHDIILEEILQKLNDESLIPTLEDTLSQDSSCTYCGSSSIYKHGKDSFGHQCYLCRNSDCYYKTFTAKMYTIYLSISSPIS